MNQIVLIMRFVIISNVGIKTVLCIFIHILLALVLELG